MGMIAAAAGILGGVSSIMQGRSAAKQAKKAGEQAKRDAEMAAAEQERLGRENAALIEAETMEKKRIADQEASEAMAAQRAKAAASGVATDTESSFDVFMGSEKDKFDRNIDWLLKSGKSQADLAVSAARSGANITRSQGRAALANAKSQAAQYKASGWSQGIGGIFGGIGSMYTGITGRTAGNKWWDWS
jgi:hypothetical protein